MKAMKEILKENAGLDQITEKIIGCAYEVSNTLGSGFLESVYEKALHHQSNWLTDHHPFYLFY